MTGLPWELGMADNRAQMRGQRVLTLAAGVAILAIGAFFGRGLWLSLEARAARASTLDVRSDDLYNPQIHLFKRGRRDLNEVCISFDDGPHPQSLPKILDILKEFHVKATFFLVGRRIQEHPEQVREILREGHEVGNHTQNHLRLDNLSPDQVRMELAMCESNFEQVTGGTKMTLFRAPGLRVSPEVLAIANQMGYTTVSGNYGGKDFQIVKDGPTITPENHIASFVLENVTPGGIILLHDNPDTASVLRRILQGLRDKGLAVKNVSEMLADLPEPVHVASNAGKLGKLAMK
jgi:peptidoglycan/xylan/chitin deacetylase (PgdA/CDA1 family)